MIIFSKAQNNKKKDTKKWLFSFLSIYFLLSISFLVLFCIFIITSEFFSLKKKAIYEKIFKRGRIEYIYIPKIFFESLKSNFIKIENLDIRISAERQLIIENERTKLIEFYNNYKLKPDLDHYEANVFLDANKKKDIRASISLKGFRAVHWNEKEKSSYSVKLKGDETFLGMDEFDVNKPRARNYVHEWIFYKFAKSIGLAVPKYEFIKMSINGNKSNLYVAEEGMTNKLIERNKRRNGPIFKVTGEYTFKDSTIEVYNKRYWQRPENKDLYTFANTKMNDFKNGKISHEDFFDMDLWARYFAMTDVLSTHHGALIKSPKFYYNSLSGKFEPIPNDGHRHHANYWKYNSEFDGKILIEEIDESIAYSFARSFFYKNNELNLDFVKKYLTYLKEYTSTAYLDKFFDKNISEIKKLNSLIYNDYYAYDNIFYYGPGIYYFRVKDYYKKSELINDKIRMKNSEIGLKLTNNTLKFGFSDHPYLKRYPLIKFISYNCLDAGNEFEFLVDIFVYPKEENNFLLENDQKCKNFNIKYSNLYNEIRDFNLFNTKFNKPIFNIDKLNTEYLAYFSLDQKNLIPKKNPLIIEKNIYIPSGLEVKIKGGQKIFLINNSSIVSRSPIMTQNETEEIFIGGKENNFGGGVYVFETEKLSKLSNVKIAYLNGFIQNQIDLSLLGSINFYKSNAKLNNVEFNNIKSEDAINSYRANIEINNAKFNQILSDAIDIDFGSGNLTNLIFDNIRNDAIDVSGSTINISNINANNCGDKIISVGEQSKIKISNLQGNNSFIGIANKDASITKAENIKLNDVKIGFASYIKKNEYLPPYLNVKDFIFNSEGVLYLKDKESKLEIDSKTQTKINNQIIKIIYDRELNYL